MISLFNPLLHTYSFLHTNNRHLLKNIVGKGEHARNEQFLVFQQYFLLNQITVSPFVRIFDIISLFAAEFEEPKIGISGKRLRVNLNSYKNHIYMSLRIQITFLRAEIISSIRLMTKCQQ